MRSAVNLAAAISVAMGVACARSHTHTHAHGQGAGYHHRFDDAEKWAREFESPERDAWQKPDEVIRALALASDAKVADIGSGTGYFAVRLARALPRGAVFAVDIEPEMVRYLSERSRREGLTNVVSVLGAAEDPKLPEPVDLVLVVNTYHHIDHRPMYFRRLAEKLRPGGRVAIVDFTKESPHGPPPEMRLTAGQVTAEFEHAGYALAEQHAFLPHQYVLVFTTKR